MVISIQYEEPNTNEYQNVTLGDKVWDSGDFVKDWFNMTKYMAHLPEEKWEPTMCSSSVDHFIMDGAPYDSAGLREVDGVWVLDYDIEGVEFFVPKGKRWTWEELKNYCKDEKLLQNNT